ERPAPAARRRELARLHSARRLDQFVSAQWHETGLGSHRRPIMSRNTKKRARSPKLTREQIMDARAARDFAHMQKVNAEARAEMFRIMNEPAPEWQHKGGHAGPSRRGRSW